MTGVQTCALPISDEGEARRVLGREDVPVQRPDAVVVDGEPVQVQEREMVAIPEGQCHALPVC